jgi:hypothetical protein
LKLTSLPADGTAAHCASLGDCEPAGAGNDLPITWLMSAPLNKLQKFGGMWTLPPFAAEPPVPPSCEPPPQPAVTTAAATTAIIAFTLNIIVEFFWR